MGRRVADIEENIVKFLNKEIRFLMGTRHKPERVCAAFVYGRNSKQ